MHHVDDSIPPSSSDDSTKPTWFEKDQLLLSGINATLSDSALPYIIGLTSIKQAWDLLNNRYASTAPAYVMSLKQLLPRLKKGTQSMVDYLQQFKVISDQLTACGSPLSEDDLLIHILDSLPPSYRQLCSSVRIYARTSTLSIEELHTLLICEDLSLIEDTPPAVSAQSTALVASKPFRPNNSRQFS
ncbi:uncharacterized protein LOC130138798 [Syzygium oleosum]|uniref:uncharacterized protein LOC130138798 n=1 Tax=Syzygium oleosum TaxID=219896 RepID=UPI0024BB9209|nr:uncharacterized protein LOC130138798 [Syzygium oleosum]